MNQKLREALVIIIIAITVFATITIVFVRIRPFNIEYAGGYEIKTMLSSVTVGDKKFSSSNTQNQIVRQRWGAKAVNFDPDAGITNGDYTDLPNIKVLIDDPVHANFFEGKLQMSELSQVHKTYSKTFTRTDGTKVTYYWDHHIYTFNVKIETDGDAKDIGSANDWWHYIAESAGYTDQVAHITVTGELIIDPWQIAGEIHEDEDSGLEYRVVDSWAGIMQISCVDYTKGLSDRTLNAKPIEDAQDTVITGWTVENFPVGGDPLNMWFLNRSLWGTGKVFQSADEIKQVPGGVYFDVPVSLQAGAGSTANWDFALPTVYDVFYNGRFRADIMTARGYVPVVGDDPPPEDPDPEKPGPHPFEWPLIEFFGDWFGDWAWVIVLAIFGIIVILILVFAWRIYLLRAMFRSPVM